MAYRLKDQTMILSSRSHFYYTRRVNTDQAKNPIFHPSLGGFEKSTDHVLLTNVTGTRFILHPDSSMVMLGMDSDYRIPYKDAFIFGSAFGYMPSNFKTPPSISVQINANLAYLAVKDVNNPPTLFIPVVFGGIAFEVQAGRLDFNLNLLTVPPYHANTIELESGSWIEHINLNCHVLPDRQYDFIVLGIMHVSASSATGRTLDSITKLQRNTNVNTMLHINDGIVPMYDPAS